MSSNNLFDFDDVVDESDSDSGDSDVIDISDEMVEKKIENILKEDKIKFKNNYSNLIEDNLNYFQLLIRNNSDFNLSISEIDIFNYNKSKIFDYYSKKVLVYNEYSKGNYDYMNFLQYKTLIKYLISFKQEDEILEYFKFIQLHLECLIDEYKKSCSVIFIYSIISIIWCYLILFDKRIFIFMSPENIDELGDIIRKKMLDVNNVESIIFVIYYTLLCINQNDYQNSIIGLKYFFYYLETKDIYEVPFIYYKLMFRNYTFFLDSDIENEDGDVYDEIIKLKDILKIRDAKLLIKPFIKDPYDLNYIFINTITSDHELLINDTIKNIEDISSKYYNGSFLKDNETKRLLGSGMAGYINDDIINRYSHLCLHYAKDSFHSIIYYATGFFSNSLILPDDYVKTFNTKIRHLRYFINIFNHRLLIFPINVNSNHWICIVVCNLNKKIYYFDSLIVTDNVSKNTTMITLINEIKKYLQYHWKKFYPYSEEINFDDWDFENSNAVQNDGYNCGIYVCLFIRLVIQFIENGGDEIKFNKIIKENIEGKTQDELKILRKQMLLEIYHDELYPNFV